MTSHPFAARPARRDTALLMRRLAVVLWCSFLAASAATMVAFALVDPMAISEGQVPTWWTTRLTVYAVGFFFFWGIAMVAAACTIFMASTERGR